jgi:hypothetical protein
MALSIVKKHISKNRKSLKKNTKIHWDGGLSNLGKKVFNLVGICMN